MAKVMVGVDYGSYSFNAAGSQVTLNLNGVPPKLESVLLITNVTDNIIIYNFANPALGGTLSGNVLTLDYSTVAMSDTDKLQIWYYNENAQQTDLVDLAMSIKRDIQMIRREPNMTPQGLNTFVTNGALTTVSTVSTVSQMLYFGVTTDGGYGALSHQIWLNQKWQLFKNNIIT